MKKASAIASGLFLLALAMAASAQEPVEQAKALIADRRFDEAIAVVSEALNREPNSADLHLELGRAYANKFFARRAAEFREKALRALHKSLDLRPSLAYSHFMIGQIAAADRRYKDAIKGFEEASRIDPSLVSAYQRKWQVMVRSRDFEIYLPQIRRDIETLLKRTEGREDALEAAALGYDILSEEELVKEVEDRVISELPASRLAEGVLLRRIYSETDPAKKALRIDGFVARFPGNQNISQLNEIQFKLRVARPETADAEIARSAAAWVRSATRDAEQMVKARSAAAIALAERKTELALAAVFADEAVNVADKLNSDSPLLAEFKVNERENLIRLIKEKAHTARGFVLLRKGDIAGAAKELTGPLEPVVREVERRGFVLWRDTDLRELGARPRALWLAELYEAQGRADLAARFLLASFGDDERANNFIRERLPVVYQKLGRAAKDAEANLRMAEARFRSLNNSPASKEEGKRRALANRINRPAGDFRVTALDRRELRLSEFSGKVVVLNFWATWCGPCLAEFPHFQKTFERYKADPRVVFLAVSIDENRAAVRPFIQRRGYSFVSAYDEDAAEGLKVRNIPSTIIIDRDGMIQFREDGFGGEGRDYIDRMIWRIDDLLEKNASPAGGVDERKESNGRQK
jgi:thiol-disulfide isomerase/thioredoxin